MHISWLGPRCAGVGGIPGSRSNIFCPYCLHAKENTKLYRVRGSRVTRAHFFFAGLQARSLAASDYPSTTFQPCSAMLLHPFATDAPGAPTSGPQIDLRAGIWVGRMVEASFVPQRAGCPDIEHLLSCVACGRIRSQGAATQRRARAVAFLGDPWPSDRVATGPRRVRCQTYPERPPR